MSAYEEAVIHERLTGAAQVTAGLNETAAATERVAATTDAAGLSMERTARRSFLMNQALFTVRRFLYLSTLATVAFTVATVKWGFTYLSAMQQGRIALRSFLPDQKAVNAELRELYNLSAYTPFQFKDLLQAAQTLYAFGFTTKQVNTTLNNLTDALVATGKATPAGINRISTALGHMMSIGHATGQVLLQLARDGIPGVYESIKKYFRLTDDQMAHIGNLRLPADQVLTAINQGIATSHLHGLARREQEGSLHGVYTTFRDFMSRITGDIENHPFKILQKDITDLNPVLNRMGTGFEKNGFKGMLDAMGNSTVASHIRLWVTYLQQLWKVLTDGVIPAIMFWLHILQPVTSAIMILASILSILTSHSTILKWVTIALIGQFIILRVQALYLASAERAAAIALWFERSAMVDLRIMTFLLGYARTYYLIALMRTVIWTRIAAAADWAWTTVLYAVSTAQGILTGLTLATRDAIVSSRAWTIAVTAADWLWITAIYAVAAAEGILLAALALVQDSMVLNFIWTKAVTAADWLWIAAIYAMATAEGVLTRAFLTEKIAAATAWIATLGPIAVITAAVIALAGWLYLVVTRFNEIKNAFFGLPKSFSDVVTGKVAIPAKGPVTQHDVVQAQLGGASLPSFHHIWKKLTGMASGGVVEQAGWAWVGERGRELRWMPQGAGVVPLPQARSYTPGPLSTHTIPQASGIMPDWQGDQSDRPIVVQLVVDGKKLAEIVAKHKSDEEARY